MCALLVKRFSSLLLSSSHRHLPLLRLTFSTQSQKKKEDLPFIAQYLISSFGLSLDRALKLSARSHLAAIKSSARPDSVIGFLKDTGLSDSQIKAAISFEPLLLSSNVEETLKPRLRELEAAGFTGEILVQFILHNPTALSLKNTVSRLQFWREFVGNNDEALLKVIRRNPLLFKCNIDKYVLPKLNLFREYGLSTQEIITVLTGGSWLMLRSLDYLRRVFEQTRKLGVQHGSTLFMQCLFAVGSCNETTLNQRMAFFKKSYGWSEADICSAFRKYPPAIGLSKGRVKSHMDFLTRKAMLDPRSIASVPRLLGCSMEKVLVPRHHILSILKERGLKDYKLFSACLMSEERFHQKFVVPYQNDVPGLAEAYAAACSGKVPL